ncbi:hypothetical protein B4589_013970 [Halolamina sp. CBA1230]|uniref:hypothetical protein n=1 Tax=Halolamina sp. CBA1230 TaxID=1853690 RepID=UPI0009A1BF7D|nr:hypothetical protein [Halolamina sp. CBA1230]QKY21424.1 hypothetical protein B4589_013970 [Halolamina sp. CBA1230]
MQRSRRAVLAAVPVALAGCGRSLRENTVPGGLDVRNRRSEAVTVSVRAALLPELEENDGDGVGITESPTATPATPRDADLDDPAASGEYRVGPESERRVPDFFPQGGRWAFEAVVDDEDVDGDRTRIVLHTALPGPTGADTMLVTVRRRRVTARATTVD